MRRVYLDHNATSPPGPGASACRSGWPDHPWANPASAHAEGRAARGCLEQARAEVAAMAGVEPAAVVFTSGGTEGAHAALRGMTAPRQREARRRVVISGVEHPAVTAAARSLAAAGCEVVVVPPDADGVVEADRFLDACTPETVVAALVAAQNEIGTLQPVREVASGLEPRGIVLVVDAVQAPGRVSPVLPAAGPGVVGILSAHKFGGLPGAGALIVDPDLVMEPLFGGGEQERGRRAGTPPLPLIAVMGTAAAELSTAGSAGFETMRGLRDRFEAALEAEVDGIRVIGLNRERLPNTSAFLLEGVIGEDLVAALDLRGVAVSSGSACSTGSSRPSETLLAMGVVPAEARGLVRVSLGRETCWEDLEFALGALQEAVPRLRSHAPSRAGAGR